MKNDFTSIFKALEPTEQAQFRQYIQFFYGQQKTVLTVFDQVVQTLLTEGEEQFFSAASKNKKMQNDLSDLKKWLLEFLTIQEVKTNSLNAQFLTLDALHKRRLKPVFLQKAKQLDKILRGYPSPDMWTMLQKLRLTHIHYFDLEMDVLQDCQSELRQLMDELDSFYMSAKLKYSAELQSRTNILQDNYNPRLLDEVLAMAEDETQLEPQLKHFYLPLFRLVKEQSVTVYKELKKLLNENKHHESIERLSVLFYLLNFAINRIREGKDSYRNDYFELMELGLSQSLFIATGNMSTEVFTNAVNLACISQKHQWAEDFVKNCSKYLEPTEREVRVNLSLARIYFDQKKYKDASDLLIKITSYKNVSVNVNARLLLARTYYEQQQPEQLQLNYCDSLYLYAYRSKSLGLNMKTSILNFTKILHLLIQGKSKKQLVKELENLEHPIICLEWLKAKIDERKR